MIKIVIKATTNATTYINHSWRSKNLTTTSAKPLEPRYLMGSIKNLKNAFISLASYFINNDKYSFKVFSSFILVITPLIASEMDPVSSDTTIVSESVISDIPNAALCLEPVVFSKFSLLDKIKYAPAQIILSPRTMTAPSCSGVFGVKILTSNSLDTSEFNVIARCAY